MPTHRNTFNPYLAQQNISQLNSAQVAFLQQQSPLDSPTKLLNTNGHQPRPPSQQSQQPHERSRCSNGASMYWRNSLQNYTRQMDRVQPLSRHKQNDTPPQGVNVQHSLPSPTRQMDRLPPQQNGTSPQSSSLHSQKFRGVNVQHSPPSPKHQMNQLPPQQNDTPPQLPSLNSQHPPSANVQHSPPSPTRQMDRLPPQQNDTPPQLPSLNSQHPRSVNVQHSPPSPTRQMDRLPPQQNDTPPQLTSLHSQKPHGVNAQQSTPPSHLSVRGRSRHTQLHHKRTPQFKQQHHEQSSQRQFQFVLGPYRVNNVSRQQQQQQQRQHPTPAYEPTRRLGQPIKKTKRKHGWFSYDSLDLLDNGDDSTGEEATKKNKDNSIKDDGVIIPMPMKEFERILDYRQNRDTGERQLLIKYKYTSFHHVDWVPLEQINQEHMGKARVTRFLKKWEDDGRTGQDFREHLILDRIVDDGELVDPVTGELKIYYLCKWNGQSYDQCTWENEDDAEKIDGSKVEEFFERQAIPESKLGPPPLRPKLQSFLKYDRSPTYGYGNELRSYQLEGLNWLRFCYYDRRSCILADEMGLGKTVQAVALLNDIYHIHGIKGPFLIVAPLSTIPHWERVFKAWTDLHTVYYHGSPLARDVIMDTEFYYQDDEGNNILNCYKFDVLITTYEMAIGSASVLRKIHWKCGVFDEAHRLKNKDSKAAETLRPFHIDHKLLLTGTPLQNNLNELYSLLNFMQPDIFDDEDFFFSEYGSLESAAEVENLQTLLKPIILRRFKEDVEKTIPVKEETVVEVQLTNPQKKWYRAVFEKNFSFLNTRGKANKELPNLRNIMMQLRKCCIHPYLLEGVEDVIVSDSNAKTSKDLLNCLIESSGKLVLLDKLLKKLLLGNHKVLIFSQFTSCLDILSDYLEKREYAYERIDGTIPGEKRQASIDRFSTLPIEESFVFLLCTRAGGVGINLTAADTCIIFDSDWNPQNDLQAQARCHRIGQTKPVQIYRLICANTYEKDMFEKAGMKLGLDKAIMSRSGVTGDTTGGQASRHELTNQEIEDLLKKGAYGALMDEEASTRFCEEDIDQILERRSRVIRHEGNEQGSIFSKATFSSGSSDGNDVELDDPNFWEKWAAKANVITTPLCKDKITPMTPSSRSQRRTLRPLEDNIFYNYSWDNTKEDSDAYEEEDDNETEEEEDDDDGEENEVIPRDHHRKPPSENNNKEILRP